MAPTKPRRNHETSGAMASASLTDPFFEVPFMLAFFAAAGVGLAQSLDVTNGTTSKTFTAAQLLANKAARDIEIADPVYKHSMTYRVIPMVGLRRDIKAGSNVYVQARAVDAFSIAIPAALLKEDAFLAIETAAASWPKLPGTGTTSAGPFYIVWQSRSDAGISSEYWVYHLASLTITDSPAKRWPGLAVGADVPAAAPVHRGLDRFVAVCMACHCFAGEGKGTQGPDLARPMNPVDYFQPAALRKFLCDPRSVRAWSEQKMPAFSEESLLRHRRHRGMARLQGRNTLSLKSLRCARPNAVDVGSGSGQTWKTFWRNQAAGIGAMDSLWSRRSTFGCSLC
jgi:mono/diheme cytochrome c family protein